MTWDLQALGGTGACSPASEPVCLSAHTVLCARGSLHTRFSARVVLCTHDSLHTWFSAHMALCTRGSLCTGLSARVVLCTHSSLRVWFSAHTVLCTRGSLYTRLWSPSACKPPLFTQCLESLPATVPSFVFLIQLHLAFMPVLLFLFFTVASASEPSCQCRTHKRCGFDPWVRKFPWRRAWPPAPAVLPGEPQDRGAWRG